jgi:hypothetical protein
VVHFSYVPVAATPVEGLLARWRRRHGEWSLHNINQLFYTAYIHVALGVGGPRWRPLNAAVAMSEWRDASWELVGGNGEGGAPFGYKRSAAAAWQWMSSYGAGF